MRLFTPNKLFALYTLVMLAALANLILYTADINKTNYIWKTKSLSIADYQRAHKKVIYGFLPYWTLNKADYIQLDKLTNVAYFALSIEKDGSIKKVGDDGNLDPGYNNWKNSKDLNDFIARAKEKNVDVALTIISHEADITDAFLDCKSCWNTLYEQIDAELKEKDLSSINVDFEYADYTTKDKALKYSAFIKFLNENLDKSHENGIKVVVSTFADAVNKPRVTDIPTLNKAADGMFIMAYDFHYTGSEQAGPVAPINGKGDKYSYDISSMLGDYLKIMPASKIILGVPYYGYNWVVENQTPYAPRIAGNDYIGYSQSQTYENIMETLLRTKAKVLWDSHALAPYFSYTSPANGSNRVVHFENPESLKIKYELVHKYNLQGVGIWALGYDGGYQELWDALEEKFGS